jgi:hypothetical protein
VKDAQVQRYARHIALPEIGGLGQTAIMVAVAKLALRETEPTTELVAGSYLAAAGVGTLVLPNASDAQRAELAARGPDTRVLAEGDGVEVVLSPRPAWWPSADGDATALAFWRGATAATQWLWQAASK